MRILGFIPARKGSKGIKNKNLVKFNKKPLIFSTINFSKKLRFVTPFVSTNSTKILNYAKKNGIKYNYLRPEYLSNNKSPVIKSVFHALDWFENKDIHFDAVMMLQPTTPIRKLAEANKIIRNFIKKKISSIISVTRMKEHPFECVKLNGKKWDYFVKGNNKRTRRQDYSQSYFFIDGSIYLSRVSFLKKNKSFVVKNKTELFKSSQYPGIDIDDPIDLKIGELFIKKH